KAAETILALPEFYQLTHQIIVTALKLLKDKPQGIEAAETILALPEFYRLSEQVISTALNISNQSPTAMTAARFIIKQGITKQTTLLYVSIRMLCSSTQHSDIKMVTMIFDDIKQGSQNKTGRGVQSLYHDLFWLPLMHIAAHKNRIYGLVKNYKANSHHSNKLNYFKVLKCYTVDYPENNLLSAVFSSFQQTIVKRCIDDLKHQIKNHPSQMQLGHIDLALQNVPPSDFRTQQAKAILALLQETNNVDLSKTHFYETVVEIAG
ncbi:MAG: hypothetical protein MJK04_06470, partial [Psychrosphaera sp.]|nr:hypothetical protein [Psychrosphaera sp.]